MITYEQIYLELNTFLELYGARAASMDANFKDLNINKYSARGLATAVSLNLKIQLKHRDLKHQTFVKVEDLVDYLFECTNSEPTSPKKPAREMQKAA